MSYLLILGMGTVKYRKSIRKIKRKLVWRQRYELLKPIHDCSYGVDASLNAQIKREREDRTQAFHSITPFMCRVLIQKFRCFQTTLWFGGIQKRRATRYNGYIERRKRLRSTTAYTQKMKRLNTSLFSCCLSSVFFGKISFFCYDMWDVKKLCKN